MVFKETHRVDLYTPNVVEVEFSEVHIQDFAHARSSTYERWGLRSTDAGYYSDSLMMSVWYSPSPSKVGWCTVGPLVR
jgi:hypothetical protein